ncbi:rCG23304 [Rattus norvegicus]|uniref:RCG23304 n=1 Tax=Rattus norvegicus TaxID=10116 RepID=A6JQ08_RAT|nr:rCG23304 [Rattus norvegicus]
MTLRSTHRSEPCSATIRGASSPSRWQQLETHCQTICRAREMGTFSPQSDVSIKSLSSWFKELCGRGGRKSMRARRDGGHQGIKAFWIQQG